MGKKQIEVCEICGKQNCSGKIFWAYDERNDKLHWVCESQTVLQIRSDIYWRAIRLYEKACPGAVSGSDVAVAPKKYIIKSCKEFGLPFVPVARFYFVECGNFAIAMEKAWVHKHLNPYSGFENLFVPFSQLRSGIIYNNGWERLEDVGK